MGQASIGSQRGQFSYDDQNPEEEKAAWMACFDITSERYDEVKESTRKRTEEFNKKYPLLKNLCWVTTEKGNEMYYTDDKGKRLENQDLHVDAIVAEMQKGMNDVCKGDDVTLINGQPHSRSALLNHVLSDVNQPKEDLTKYMVDLADFED